MISFITSFAPYIVLIVLFLGVLSSWQWSTFKIVIQQPPVYIMIIVGIITILLVNHYLLPKLKKLRLTNLTFIGIILILCGLFLILAHQVTPKVTELAGYDVVNFAASSIGIGIAFFSLDLTKKSDNRIRDIANLEYHEKIAVLEEYLDHVNEGKRVVSGALREDISATLQLKEFLTDNLDRQLKDKLRSLLLAAAQKPGYIELIVEIQQLLSTHYDYRISETQSEEEIRPIAYRLWEREGYYDGRALEHWLRAKIILQEQSVPI